jgi:hypothetical protein
MDVDHTLDIPKEEWMPMNVLNDFPDANEWIGELEATIEGQREVFFEAFTDTEMVSKPLYIVHFITDLSHLSHIH